MLGLAPIWSLNSATHDWDVLLQANICDSNGQCGSIHGDLDVLIPQSLLAGLDADNFVLYTEYSGASNGFEEWRFNTASSSVPEPGMVALLLAGLPAPDLFRKLRPR